MAEDGGGSGETTREQVLARAAALVPVLRERAAACEAARSCPADTVEDFRRNGLLRLCQPARYGGLELGWDVLAELAQTLAWGCASQASVLSRPSGTASFERSTSCRLRCWRITGSS